jgi:hypothetical protein
LVRIPDSGRTSRWVRKGPGCVKTLTQPGLLGDTGRGRRHISNSDVSRYFGKDTAPRGRYCLAPWADNMKPHIEPQHALSPKELDAIEVHLYEYNSQATGDTTAKA